MTNIIKKDVIIIGAGPGGMTAALYASRASLETIMIEQGAPGGELMNTADVENYPGFGKIAGPDLAMKFYESATAFNAEVVYGMVEKVEIDGSQKIVKVGEVMYQAPVVIVATGATHRKLGAPGEEALSGMGVSYCAVCDGFFFKDKDVFVIGGGDSAVEEGTYLTQFAKSVTIIHRRDALRAQQILQERAKKNPKVTIVYDSVVEEIIGTDAVEGVTIRNVKTNQVQTLQGQGVFVYVGLVPNSQIVDGLGVTNEQGWIVTDEMMRTNIPGLLAIGDVREKHLRQVATAVGDGSIAGQQAYDYIQSL